MKLEKEKKTIKNRILYYKNLKAERRLALQEKFERSENPKVIEYANYHYGKPKEKNILNAYLSGEKQEFISPLYSFHSSNLHQKYFLVDEEYNYLSILEIAKEIKIPFKDLTDKIIYYDKTKYKTFLEYKRELKEYFKDFDEGNFTENSYILIEKLKIERIDKK